MKTTLLILLYTFGSIVTFGQTKSIYLNDDLEEISKIQFDKERDFKKYYNLTFNLDTLLVNVKVQRIKKGKISVTKLDSIRVALSQSSNSIIPNNNTLVINYYAMKDECNSYGDKSFIKKKYKRYLKQLKKFSKVSQFFVYKSPEGVLEYGEQLNWIRDASGIIEKTFFQLVYPCGSYVIIDKNGSFYLQKGEYDISKIIPLLKNDRFK